MLLHTLSLVNFRNFSSFSIEFSQGVNILYGPNASGKTSVLESVYLLSFTRSFKSKNDRDLVKNGEDYYQISASWKEENEEFHINANFLKSKGKKFFYQKVALQHLSEIIGKFPIVFQSPEDYQITSGGSKEKRLFFNRLISQLSPDYIDDLILYTKLLKQRNAYLKMLKSKKKYIYDEQLEVYDEQLAPLYQKIYSKRLLIIESFFLEFKELYENYFSKNEKPEIVYKATVQGESSENFLKNYFEKSRQNVESEIILSRTLIGPNYDKIRFLRNGKELNNFASQGEHKLWMTIMKLAEGKLLKTHHGKEPLYLFDDLFAELDINNSKNIIENVKNLNQVIISSTDLSDIRNHGVDIDDPSVKVFNFPYN